jgi:hypothetical protein
MAVRPRVAHLHRRLARTVDPRANVTRAGIRAVTPALAARARDLTGRTWPARLAAGIQNRPAPDQRPRRDHEQGQRNPRPP